MQIRPPVGRNNAFTLIELVVVLVLIGIMAAVIVPEMRGTFEGEVLRSTSRNLANALGLAYSQSVSLNQRHRLVIDTEKSRYRIERLSRSEEEGSGFVPLQNVSGAEGRLDERIRIEVHEPASNGEEEGRNNAMMAQPDAEPQPRNSVTFMPDGRAQAAEIRLRDRTGFGLALRVNPITARVRVVELKREVNP